MAKLMFLFVTPFALLCSQARADKLSDFKDAVGNKGCDSIPYSDLRSTCKSQQSEVHDYCDGKRGPVTCGSARITRDLKENIEKKKKDVESLKNKKRSLEDQKSRASDESEKNRIGKEIDQVERDIYEAGKLVDAAISEFDERKKLVENAIYYLDKCVDYRRAVMNVFATALDKVRGETDDDIKPLARELRDRYEASKSGHETAIKDKQNALDTCKDSRP